MQAEAPLFHHDGALAIGHAGEHLLGHRAGDDGEAGLGILPQQVIDQSGAENGITDTAGGDEENAHATADTMPLLRCRGASL